jgi:N-carbamoylputrescine amidase
MKVTVCELANDPEGFAADWERLVDHVKAESSELVLLPEMPFYPWPFVNREFDGEEWGRMVSAHENWINKLDEMGSAAVLGTRPTTKAGKRLNQAFVWTQPTGLRTIHSKYYLPDEEGYWEASWYDRGKKEFLPFKIGTVKLGFLICSELWSMPQAIAYGKAGVHIIAVPRATGKATVEKWLVGGRACSVVSGCFSLSSNRFSRKEESGLGGLSWIVDPNGNVLGTTSQSDPFLTRDIDIGSAVRSKKTYPRYSIFA